MLLNLRSSVNWRLNAVACLCGVSLFFLASNVSAQETTTAYYSVGAEGVWVESEWDGSPPLETAGPESASAYRFEASEMPAYDSATAVQQYEPSIEMPSEAYETYEAYEANEANEAYEAYDSLTEEPAAAYTVVKNRDFFGVDKDSCCDEWTKFCNFKDIKFNCGCGGLKANKGHLGIKWLRSADEGEDCDYCQGGCCDREKSAGRERRDTRRNVFSSAWNKATRSRCDECDPSNCPEEEGCTSCR